MSLATVWNGYMASPVVWGPSAFSSRHEDVQLHWRLCRRSWCASDWREAQATNSVYESIQHRHSVI